MGGKPKKQVIGYHYGCTLHMGVGLAADEIYKIIVGGKEAWRGSVKNNATVTINNPNLFGGEKAEGGIVGSLSVMMGVPDQPRNSLLVRLLGNLTSAFRGFVGLVFDGWLCAMNPYPKTWEIAYRRILAGWPDNNPWYPEKALITLADGQIHAMNPAHMLYESYISNTWGAGEARARMDDAAFKAAADTLYTEGFGLCIEWKVTDDRSLLRYALAFSTVSNPCRTCTSSSRINNSFDCAPLICFKKGSLYCLYTLTAEGRLLVDTFRVICK